MESFNNVFKIVPNVDTAGLAVSIKVYNTTLFLPASKLPKKR